ncbi:sulfite exporter TauE/SafE family protein [Candidatus Paracaedibacter symbiosus]|uniref:sulfite exporter TauE/SafE family protein n=1 Tax=Candidatus Paracaedibacter symbiosus TaxID=244582 RepID=UPI0005096124|nr:sulfite exporter TauE/SafE family protein [Candidatus Paracaedibacter symbiosus]
MTILNFSLIIFCCAISTGVLGALTGLGGGIFLTPILVMFLGIEPHYALATSLIAAISTSSGASITFLKEKLTNFRIGLFLETAAVIGAPIGAMIAIYLPKQLIFILFGLLLSNAAYSNVKGLEKGQRRNFNFISDPLALKLDMPDQYMTSWGEIITYPVRKIKMGWSLMFGAGVLSGVLGIGSGSLKVLAMDQIMGLPYKVSTATSNFMIGLTAIASVGVYWSQGFLIPELTMPVIPGVLIGAYIGSKTVAQIPIHKTRWIFTIVLTIFAIQMLVKGFL